MKKLITLAVTFIGGYVVGGTLMDWHHRNFSEVEATTEN
jgi:hypothetical protein